MSDGDRDPAEGRDAVDLIGVAPGISHRVECHFGAPWVLYMSGLMVSGVVSAALDNRQ